MPVGKNSIKRVSNNGYSNVKTDAPDMQNSTVIANVSDEVAQVMLPKTDASKGKKISAAKKTVKKNAVETSAAENEKDTAVSSAEYVNLGEEMPVYLL